MGCLAVYLNQPKIKNVVVIAYGCGEIWDFTIGGLESGTATCEKLKTTPTKISQERITFDAHSVDIHEDTKI